MDGGTWWAAVHGVAKSRTPLSDFTFTFHFHALEKEMATHSSVLAWRIPGIREPGGLLSMGLHRVGHDWSDWAAAAAAANTIRVWLNLWVWSNSGYRGPAISYTWTSSCVAQGSVVFSPLLSLISLVVFLIEILYIFVRFVLRYLCFSYCLCSWGSWSGLPLPPPARVSSLLYK